MIRRLNPSIARGSVRSDLRHLHCACADVRPGLTEVEGARFIDTQLRLITVFSDMSGIHDVAVVLRWCFRRLTCSAKL